MPRPHSWMDYRERLSRVTSYIHDHLHEPLDLQRLADVAHLSAYHWHRVYHALYGETVAATVRRLRLHRASGYLVNTAQPVASVARLCGYPNVQSFTRAFHAMYGCSPSHYRAHGSPSDPTANSTATPPTLGPGNDHTAYRVTVRDVPVIHLAGLSHRGSYMQIGRAFGLAHTHMAAQGLMRAQTRWLSVYYDDPFAVPERQLSSRAGLSLPADTSATPLPPLESFTLGGGPCAVLHYQGPYAHMRAAYQWLHGHWLVQSGRAAADAPVFEEYLNHPSNTAPADLLTDIYLPLAP